MNPRVAILVTDGIDRIELDELYVEIVEHGGIPVLISPKRHRIHAADGCMYIVDVELGEADAANYDILLLPGGVISADTLRDNPAAVGLVRAFSRKPIASMGAAQWLLIEAGMVAGKRVTSTPSIRTDLDNAGAIWSDEPCATDGLLVTARRADDSQVLVLSMLEVLAAQVGRLEVA